MSVAARPPELLVSRVGWYGHTEAPGTDYDARAVEHWALIRSLVPPDLLRPGATVLEFGCGAGRLLSAAATADPLLDLWGCDIDADSLTWLKEHGPDGLTLIRNAPLPPLAVPDHHFDVVWAFSVFTHLQDSWSAWLAEMQRVLKPGGVLVATVFGPGVDAYGDESLSDDRIGMNPVHVGSSWDIGGPLMLHSRWWLEAHWGRAFDVVEFREGADDRRPPLLGQSVLVLRPKAEPVSVEELERPEPGEPREWSALLASRARIAEEAVELQRLLADVRASRAFRYAQRLRELRSRRR